MLKKVGLAVAALLIALCLYVASQPSDFNMTREIRIEKNPEVIFPYINNPKKMDEWAPWKDMDPQLVMSYSGPEAGVGAKASWESKGRMGVGSATVIESIPNTKVKTQLEYLKPFEMSQVAELSIQSEGKESVVRWSVTGKQPFFARLICFVANMKKGVEKNFDDGLLKLKKLVEGK